VATFCLLKKSRLRKREDFLHLQQKSHFFSGRYLAIQWKKSQLPAVRLGITVTRKYGDAVIRNRVKRLIREAFRLGSQRNFLYLDVNIKPKSSAKNQSLQEIFQDLELFFSSFNRSLA